MRLFALIGGLVVLVLVAALAVPPLVDWTVFRTAFERQAERLLGQPVTVGGATSARLLPFPKVEFEEVVIGGGGGRAPLLTFDRLALDVEIAPLLRGDVRIVTMELDRPQGQVTIGDGGRLDWLAGERELTLSPSDVSIERLNILEGELTVRDATDGSSFTVFAIDAALTADTLAGPWRGEGGFTYAGNRYEASGTTGSANRTGGELRVATRLTVEPLELPYAFTATGPVTVAGSDLAFDGAFTVEPRDGAQPIRAGGQMTLDRDGLKLPAFTVRVGEGDDPYRLTGTAEAGFDADPAYAVTLRGAQVDVDRLAADENDVPLGLEARLAVLNDLLRRLPLPDVQGTIAVELPAIVAGDTVIRGLSASLRPDGNTWAVDAFEATLPGRTLLEASGKLVVPRGPGGAAGFEGRLLVASRQPSGLATWLVGDVDDAIRRLGAAGFEARVALDGTTARFDDLELRLGGDRLTGTLARVAPQADGARGRILANLDGTRIDVDVLRALFGLFSGRAAEAASANDVLAHDLDLRLRVDEARAFGLAAQAVDLVALYEGSDLSVDRLTVDRLEGASLDVKGRIENVNERPKGRMRGTVALIEPARAMATLQARGLLPAALRHLAEEPALLDGTRLDLALVADGAGLESDIELDLEGTIGTTDMRAVLGYEGEVGAAEPTIEAALRASTDTPLALLRQLGLTLVPIELEGPAEALLQLTGRQSDMRVQASLTTPDGRIATQGRTRYAPGQGDIYEGRFDLTGDDIDPFLLAGGIAWPGVGTGTQIDLSGRIVADADEIGVDAVKGTVRGVPIETSLALDLDIEPRSRVDGRLSIASLDATTLARMVLGQSFDPATDGGGNTLGSPVLSGLDGDVLLDVGTLELADGLEEARSLEAELVLNDGDIRLDDVRADWLGGRLEGAATIAKAGQNGIVSTDLAVTDGEVARTGLVDPDAPRLAGRFDLDLAVEAQASTDRGLLRGLSGGANLTLRDARLRGFSPRAFADLLKAADAVDDAELEETAPSLASELLLTGGAEVAEVSVPFTIANGVARANGIPVGIGGVDAALELRIELDEARARGSLRGTFEPPADSVPVAGIAPDFRVDFDAERGGGRASLDATTLTTYLTTRLRERREREFAAQRAAILERQRLVRSMRLSREREKRALERMRAQRDEAAELPG